jgi:hypothetical protein
MHISIHSLFVAYTFTSEFKWLYLSTYFTGSVKLRIVIQSNELNYGPNISNTEITQPAQSEWVWTDWSIYWSYFINRF